MAATKQATVRPKKGRKDLTPCKGYRQFNRCASAALCADGTEADEEMVTVLDP